LKKGSEIYRDVEKKGKKVFVERKKELLCRRRKISKIVENEFYVRLKLSVSSISCVNIAIEKYLKSTMKAG
jgi:hypothetical protein